jgi:hypothetical protein
MQSACQISAYAHYARTPVLQLKQRTDDFVCPVPHKGACRLTFPPPLLRGKEAMAPATHREGRCLGMSEFIIREPYKLAKESINRNWSTLAHTYKSQGKSLSSKPPSICQSYSPIYLQFHLSRRHHCNEHVNALASKSTTTYSDVADTSINAAGP